MNLNELKTADFMDALFATNGDAMLIETREDAEYAKDFADGAELVAVMPGEEKFDDICEKLELSEANEPRRVFKILGRDCAGYIAFADDWHIPM